MKPYLEFIIKYRWLVMGLTVLATLFMGYQIKSLKVIIDTKVMEPRWHPYVLTSTKVEETFGTLHTVVIGITPKSGDVFQPNVLEKVQKITSELYFTPGVLKNNILSLATKKTKDIIGTKEGMEVRQIMDSAPRTQAESNAIRARVRANPIYYNAILSPDEKTTAVIAGFKDPEGFDGFQGIMAKVHKIVDPLADDSVEFTYAGPPAFLSLIEKYAERIAVLFLLAVLITGLIHYEAFRTFQGLVLPLVTAFLAVIWGLGGMSLAGAPFDLFNSTTPILILAVAAGHAVQILKRYYESYAHLRKTSKDNPKLLNNRAVVDSMTRVAPVMLAAGTVAACGFLSLIVFDIVSIRTFGIFTAFGIFSALILEMTFIPALRSALRPPGDKETARESKHTVWDKITERMAVAVATTSSRRVIYFGLGILLLVSISGVFLVKTDNNLKTYFTSSQPVRQQDTYLNSKLGGTNVIYVLLEGDKADAIKSPDVLKAMDGVQEFLKSEPKIGKTLSLADFVKRMNRAMHADDPKFDVIPDSQDLISQYLLLYSTSGDPGDFDSYVDYEYKNANLWIFAKDDSTAYFETIVPKIKAFLEGRIGKHVKVSVGGSPARATALNEVMVKGKIKNILQIMGVVFILSSLLFRSLIAGLFVLIPLVIAVLVNFGIMGLGNIPLNITNAITSAMAVGIGADYAIYLIYRIREELKNGVSEEEAFKQAFTHAGKAILFVSTAIAGGYGVLALSFGFYMHIWMAILIVSAMLVSALSALIVMPSLMLTFRPRFIFPYAKPSVSRARVMQSMLFLIAAGLLGHVNESKAAGLGVEEIMKRNFSVSKVSGSAQDMTMQLINDSGQTRTRKTTSFTKLQRNGHDTTRVVRFLSPPDVKNTTNLLVEHSNADDDIWIYLPALKKVRRIVASNKKDSFVGTDFSYGDVIGHKVEDWKHKFVKEDSVDGARVYVIESIPKNDSIKASSGYSKILYTIRQDNFVTIKAEYWDVGNQPLKETTFSDLKQVDPANGKWQAMKSEAKNFQTGHKTVISFDSYKLEPGVKDDLFTTRYLEKEL